MLQNAQFGACHPGEALEASVPFSALFSFSFSLS